MEDFYRSLWRRRWIDSTPGSFAIIYKLRLQNNCPTITRLWWLSVSRFIFGNFEFAIIARLAKEIPQPENKQLIDFYILFWFKALCWRKWRKWEKEISFWTARNSVVCLRYFNKLSKLAWLLWPSLISSHLWYVSRISLSRWRNELYKINNIVPLMWNKLCFF